MSLIVLGFLCSAATQMIKLLLVQTLLKDTDPRQNAAIQVVAALIAYGLVVANASAGGLLLTFASVWGLLPTVLVVFGAATGTYHLASSKGSAASAVGVLSVGVRELSSATKPGLATSLAPVQYPPPSEPLFPGLASSITTQVAEAPPAPVAAPSIAVSVPAPEPPAISPV